MKMSNLLFLIVIAIAGGVGVALNSHDDHNTESSYIQDFFNILSNEKVVWAQTSKEVKEMKKELGVIKKQLAKLTKSDSRCKYPVAFFAKNFKDATVTGGHILKYDTVVTDTCNSFNKITGVFKSPSPGVYVFHFHALNTGKTRVVLILYKNGSEIIHLWADDKGNREMGGNSALLLLNKGDQIYVRVPGWASFTLWRQYNSFSGYKIS